jgi:hypothetical protein
MRTVRQERPPINLDAHAATHVKAAQHKCEPLQDAPPSSSALHPAACFQSREGRSCSLSRRPSSDPTRLRLEIQIHPPSRSSDDPHSPTRTLQGPHNIPSVSPRLASLEFLKSRPPSQTVRHARPLPASSLESIAPSISRRDAISHRLAA